MKKCTLIVVVFAILSVMAGIAQAISSGQPAAKTSDIPNVMQQMGKSKQDLLSYKAKTELKFAEMKKDYPKCSVQVTITFAKPVARN